MEGIALLLFVLIFILILSGIQVAFVLGGISIIFGLIFVPDFLAIIPLRIMGTMQNQVLLAVPLFIYMGLMLEKSGLAGSMLRAMSALLGNIRGGLGISVILVGALLAASTGIVGATVVTMGLISLPTMLDNDYKIELATGTIVSSGTLGQIIPPSVVLVLLGSVLNVSVGALFKAALLPGLILVASYVLYIWVISRLQPGVAPPLKQSEMADDKLSSILRAFVLPFVLIIAVLGSIFAGIASPTEAAAVGAMGATILTLVEKKFSYKVLTDVMRGTTHLTSMVFLILLGATTFALVFKGLEGEAYLQHIISSSELSATTFLILVMVIVFFLGFFIDFIEIIFIVVPVVAPIFLSYGIDLIWVGILLALNLQTSFLTPPFGFSLFYLKGVAPPEVTTMHIYRGVIPFLIILVILLGLVIGIPDLIYLI